MNAPEPLIDGTAERQFLAAVLVDPIAGAAALRTLVRDGLRAEHFFRSDHQALFRALVDLAIRGITPQVELLATSTHLAREQIDVVQYIDDLLGGTDVYGWNLGAYADRVRDVAGRRLEHAGAQMLAAAAVAGDEDARAKGLDMLLSRSSVEAATTKSREQLADEFLELLSTAPPERFPWPWELINRRTRGGVRRRQIIFVSGWTGNFKSVFYDQAMLGFSRQTTRAGDQLRVHSYINEMSDTERMERMLANLSGVNHEHITTHDFKRDERQTKKVMQAINDYAAHGFGITDCVGWTAEEIATHMLVNRADVVGLDILHEIAHRDERDLAHIAQTLRAAAKQADCALLMTGHLNDQRVTGTVKPVPVLRDVRGSGMIVRCSDLVIMVHRHDDEDGDATDEGVVAIRKNRNGPLGSIQASFDAFKMRLLLQDDRWAA